MKLSSTCQSINRKFEIKYKNYLQLLFVNGLEISFTNIKIKLNSKVDLIFFQFRPCLN